MLTEDLDIFLADFGETITYTPQGGQALQIQAIVDMPSFALQSAMGEVSSYKPQATCKTSDVSNAKKNDTVTARSGNYTVTDANPDGTGFTVLLLTKS